MSTTSEGEQADTGEEVLRGAGPKYYEQGREFVRDQRYIATRITEDGRDGYPVEPGRYRLAVSRACPWANRL
ncbi:glutathione S-transferase family protein, partial [Micromonospora sp. NPDC023888]